MPPERRIEFRVGIHLGDVVEEDDGDLMGDGVNIAARLESIAEPGGICLSKAAYEQVRDKLRYEFIDLGDKDLKNIARPVRVYSLQVGIRGSVSATRRRRRGLALPDKPSIAVLPFQNMSGDPEQDYFADGMVEDIITGLSRIKWLFVIARNSSFVYKGKAVDVRQVGRELGVRYVLEGGVRKAGGRVRITAQLVEAETGAHLWADKFDGGLEDVFDLQDQITDEWSASSSRAFGSRRSNDPAESARKASTLMTSICGLCRILRRFHTPTRRSRPAFCGKPSNLIRTSPPPMHILRGLTSICFLHDGRFDEADKIAGMQHSRAAVASDVDDATALAVGATAIARLEKDLDAALDAIERALSLNASSAVALYFGAQIYAFRGRASHRDGICATRAAPEPVRSFGLGSPCCDGDCGDP